MKLSGAEDLSYLALRKSLLSRAERIVPLPDAEDVVQEALIKLLREEARPDAPDVRVRAFRALRDTRVDYFRKESRRQEKLPTVSISKVQTEVDRDEGGFPAQALEPVQRDSLLELVELFEAVEQIADPEILEYLKMKVERQTDGEIAQQSGWDNRRVARVRKRFQRKRTEIIEKLTNGSD